MRMINTPKIQSNTIRVTEELLLLDELSSLDDACAVVVGFAVGSAVGSKDKVGAMDGTKELEGIGGPIKNKFVMHPLLPGMYNGVPNPTSKVS